MKGRDNVSAFLVAPYASNLEVEQSISPFAYKFHAVSDKVILGHCASVPTLGSPSTLPWGVHELPEGFRFIAVFVRVGFGRMQRQAQSALHRELRWQRDRIAQPDAYGNSAHPATQHKSSLLFC